MTNAPVIAVIDYHKGNLSSVARGLARAGAVPKITDDPGEIRAAAGLVLPGVGSFYDAIAFMAESGQAEAVVEAVRGERRAPFLGICLGQQLLFARGNEGVPAPEAGTGAREASDVYGSELAPGAVFEADGIHWVRGLGILEGSCTRLPTGRLKVPHVGWDQVHVTEAGAVCPLLAGVAEGATCYYTHSYAVADDTDADIIAARTFYACGIPAVVWQDNVFGCQFHPEKSAMHGARIMENFVSIVRARFQEVTS